jgi:hypothetical protein
MPLIKHVRVDYFQVAVPDGAPTFANLFRETARVKKMPAGRGLRRKK